MAKLPQSEAVAGGQKKEDGTMPQNESGHRNCFHCGSKHHWARYFNHQSKAQRQFLYAAKPVEVRDAWDTVNAEVESAKGPSHINVATE